jgi:hypothetical protein
VNAVAERDEVHAQRMQMMQERDEAIRLAKNREAARVRTMFQATRWATDFDHRDREQDLIRQIKELQIDVHCLNNLVNLILPPAPVEEDGPNVLVAEDDGMEVDAKVELKARRRRPSLLGTTMVMVCQMLTVIIPRRSLAVVLG